ncbi:hypothetical protein EMIT0215P_10225 [Pseudomonas serboccidentalis]
MIACMGFPFLFSTIFPVVSGGLPDTLVKRVERGNFHPLHGLQNAVNCPTTQGIKPFKASHGIIHVEERPYFQYSACSLD